MDPVNNPFTPGAGKFPPALAGRDDVIERVALILERAKKGKGFIDRPLIFHGLRGTGKTVLLNRLCTEEAIKAEYTSIKIEVKGIQTASLASELIKGIASAQKNESDAIKQVFNLKSIRTSVENFVTKRHISVSLGDFNLKFEKPTTKSNDDDELEQDLLEIVVDLTTELDRAGKPLALFIDEMQYLSKNELSAFAYMCHEMQQRDIPFVFVGAGLPQILTQLARAKTYSERLFVYEKINSLDKEATFDALLNPLKDQNITFENKALEEIYKKSKGYPYFVQVWGKHVYERAEQSPITIMNVGAAEKDAQNELNQSFFLARFKQCTEMERIYMRALAELGSGQHSVGTVAKKLKIKPETVASAKDSLIKRTVLYSPAWGKIAFSVPLFDEFVKQQIPELKTWPRKQSDDDIMKDIHKLIAQLQKRGKI